MSDEAHGIILRQVQTLYESGRLGGLSDAELLERFSAHREADPAAAGSAFEVLLLRHGPMVLRVCRSVLRDPHAAEDALQATFMVLARRPESIRRRESVGPWLHGVALRVAASARMARARRTEAERTGAVPEAVSPDPPLERAELGVAVRAELARLPEPFRAVVELFHLEGRTHEEAADELGLPVGTIRSRLHRARRRLRERLLRRGVAPAV